LKKTPRLFVISRVAKIFFWVLFLAVVYLSWKPNPSIAQVHWIPTALGIWLDQYDFAKNLLGYGIFALFGFVAWSNPTRSASPGSSLSAHSVTEYKLLLFFCLLVVTLELGQSVLPLRTCDAADMVAGCTGILLAWLVFRLARLILNSVARRPGFRNETTRG
jgi:glycopeptide antibiotics resistance protein